MALHAHWAFRIGDSSRAQGWNRVGACTNNIFSIRTKYQYQKQLQMATDFKNG